MAIIKYRRPKIYRVALPSKAGNEWIKLMPGANDVPDKDWEKIKDHPHVKQKIEDGEIEILKTGVDSLSEIQPAKAVEIVKDTLDYGLLKKWEANESRKKVSEAISLQIQKLTTSDKVSKENKNEAYAR